MTITIMFKSGNRLRIKCKTFELEKDIFGNPTGYCIEGISENKPMYINFAEVDYISRLVSDEVLS